MRLQKIFHPIVKRDGSKDMVILRVTYTTDPPASIHAPKTVQKKTIRKYNAFNMVFKKLSHKFPPKVLVFIRTIEFEIFATIFIAHQIQPTPKFLILLFEPIRLTKNKG